MSEYIRKADAIDDLHTQLMYRMGSDDMKRRLDDWVKTLPSADVVPVIHGKWERYMSFGICDKCGYEYGWKATDARNFCPNCGAKMDGGDEHE